MQTSAIVQARMNSKRLPGKVLLDVQGKPIIEYLLERLGKSKKIDKIIVATSTDEGDLPIVDYCKQKKVQCSRGSLDNVAKRFRDTIKTYDLNSFIRICADSPLMDPEIIDAGIQVFEGGDYEIVTNVLKRTFPMGQCFEIFNSDTFLRGYSKMDGSEDLEHVTRYFYKNSKNFKIHNMETENPAYSDINLCVDTPDDFNLFGSILTKMNRPFLDYNWKEIIEIYKGIRSIS